MQNNDRKIFRFFMSADRFIGYMRGRWRGSGIHGIPEIDPNLHPQLRLSANSGRLRIEIRMPKSNDPDTALGAASFEVPFPLWKIEADCAEFTGDAGRLFLQALTERELYLIVNGPGPSGRMLFAGAVFRKRLFSL